MTNSINRSLRAVLYIITLGVFGCTAHINKNIPFSYDSDQRLPVALGLYFSPAVSPCDNVMGTSVYGYGRKDQFHIDEMTGKFWPKVFKTVFEKVHVLKDTSAEISSKDLDLIAEVRCTSFSSHLGLRGQGVGGYRVRNYWTAEVSFQITFSCPKGGYLKDYVIAEKDSVGYYDHWFAHSSSLISKLFKKTGRIFIEKFLPEAETLATKCDNKGVASRQFGENELMESLIGQNSEDVIRELGLPNELLWDDDRQFMIYQAGSQGTDALMPVWAPDMVATASTHILHCLRIELDSDNLVTDYRVKIEGTLFGSIDCRRQFWSKKELTKLEMKWDFSAEWIEIAEQWKEEEPRRQAAELLRQAKQGKAYAQLAMFKDLSEKQPEAALVWLCRSADSGNQEARVILKSIYEYGGDPWIKKGIVERDFRLAYVWHELSGADSHSSQAYLDYITSEDGQDAVKMLREWQPGNCERDLGLDGDELININ